MRTVYRVLALLVCSAVAFQAAVIVWAVAGLGAFIDGGGVLDKSTVDPAFEGGAMPYPQMQGLMLHGTAGMMVVPILVLLFLISSFFTRAPHARVMALIVVGLTLLQIFLGMMLHTVAFAGVLHGVNALLLFAAGLVAFQFARRPLLKRQPERAVADDLGSPAVDARA